MAASTPKLLDMLRALIEVPSVSSVNPSLDMGNQAVIDLLASWLNDIGFLVDVMPVETPGGKANLIATLGSGEDALVLAGHTDTVPYDDGAWKHEPFQLTEADGRLYGLGTSDMKSFFAIALAAAADFRARDLNHPLVVLATADEESSMNGAKALAASGRALGRYALIGEPTGLRPVRMHKGILMEAIRVHGRSGHSSDPGLGANALEGMHRVITELLAWRTELADQHRNPLFQVPFPTLNLGRIQGGDNPNRICGECELQVDLRPLPGIDIHELRQVLRERVERSLEGTDLDVSFHVLFEGIPAFETNQESPIVTVAEELTGHSASAVAFGTEAPFFASLGTETVILGPGDVAQAHQPDEFLHSSHIEPFLSLLRALITRFCIADSAD